MTTTQRGIILLLKSAVTGRGCPLPEDFDLETAYTPVRKHHMDALLYEGAVLCGIPRETPIMQQLLRSYCRSLIVSEGQLSEVRRIFDAFDQRGIDYLPLKGVNMKPRYPKPELRSMGDADVLIRLEQRPQIDAILRDLGFSFQRETDHEIIWTTKKLCLELHKHLINSPNRDFYNYLGTGWQLAHHQEYGLHAMDRESEFLYLFTHFSKHYRSGGIGCRYVVDLWVFLRNFPEVDGVGLRSELEKLGLLEFYGNILNLIEYWFENGFGNKKLDFMTDYIFASGSWGDGQSRALSQTVRESRHSSPSAWGRLIYTWNMIFPPREILEGKYRVLKKYPWLHPAVCICRLTWNLLFQRKKVLNLARNLEGLTKENLRDRQKMLRYVGLDYRF